MNIPPETYARWRESALGTFTAKLEQRAVFSLVGDPSGLRVLDVGCGDGVYAVEVSRRGGKVFGLDRSLSMLEAARTRAISYCMPLEMPSVCGACVVVYQSWAVYADVRRGSQTAGNEGGPLFTLLRRTWAVLDERLGGEFESSRPDHPLNFFCGNAPWRNKPGASSFTAWCRGWDSATS